MDSFAGFEPQVGEIRALRTFRIGPTGGLYPLFSDGPWVDGANTAQCLRLPGAAGTRTGRDEDPHAPPEPGCRCGFYAYGSAEAAAEYPYARHVRAVVSCWGRVVAGTRGIRAQYARIEALWLSDAVPDELARLVAGRYPSVAIYRTAEHMLAEHPLTPLDCYELGAGRGWRGPGRWLWPAAAAAAVLGILPSAWLGGPHDAELVWAVSGALFLVLGLSLAVRRSIDPAAHRRCLLCLGMALWMLAPFAGFMGLAMIRLPLLEFTALGLFRRIRMVRAAGRFPAVIN